MENVSQNEAGKTRFYVVSKRANELPGYECAVFAARIAADKLPGVLDTACSGGAKLVCVHDRPEKSALGTCRYVIELERDDGFSDEDASRLKASMRSNTWAATAGWRGSPSPHARRMRPPLRAGTGPLFYGSESGILAD